MQSGRLAALALLCALALPRAARARTYPLLDPRTTELITAEVSGDAAYDHIRVLSAYHRPQGSDTLYVAAKYAEGKARAFGLEGVRLLMLASSRATWNPGTSDLWIVGEHPERIAGSIQNRIHLADRSRPADVTASTSTTAPSPWVARPDRGTTAPSRRKRCSTGFRGWSG